MRMALRNCGQIDPQNIDHHIARAVAILKGLNQASSTMTAAEVIDEIARSGLREAGDRRFPVAGEVASLSGGAGTKMLICNAAEGDPDSLIARTLLAEDPQLLS